MKDTKKRKGKIPFAAINTLVMCLCVYAANSRCGWLLHQPEMPEEIKKLRKNRCGWLLHQPEMPEEIKKFRKN